MASVQLLPAEAKYAYTADFTEQLPNVTVTVSSVVWSITPSDGMTIGGQSDDLANARSTIFVSGQSHGATLVLQAKATLSNTEIIVKDIPLRGFNG